MKKHALACLFVVCFAIPPGAARTIVGINSSNQVFTFDSATPATISAPIAITGLVAGDQISAIDFRPANGVLYALGINSTASPNTGRIYTLNFTTGVATQIGTNFSTTLTNLASYGFDFNPTSDQIRVTNSANQNLRVNPDTGAIAGTDTNINPAGSAIVGLAHDRNDRNPNTSTTLFGLDFQNDRLVRIGGVNGSPSPNGGVITAIGATGLTTSSATFGFDIAEDGVAYASMPVSSVYRFYTINLTTGAATAVGLIGTGAVPIRGIAAVPSPVANIDSGKFFTTISAAVADAQTLAGHTIVVNAGTFNEAVTVNKALTFLGAKSGIDGNAAGRGSDESIVRGGAGSTRPTAFHIIVNNVTIDGFSIQDTNDPNNVGFGIVINPSLAGTKIRNNIIKNNIAGISVANSAENNPLIVEHNLITNNNQPGPISGTGIYADQFNSGPTFTNAVFDSNTITQNSNVGILLGATSAGAAKNIGITNNTISGCGNAMDLFNTSNAFITNNTISGSAASQVVMGGGDDGVDISENFIIGGATRGIRVGDFGGGSTNQNVVIGCNFISGNPTAGLEIDSAANSYTGPLVAQHNFWGNSSGPTVGTNPGGNGDKIVDPAGQIFFNPARFDGTDQQVEPGFQCYPAPILYGINSANNNLIRFASDNPAVFTSIPITGLVAGDTIIGIDFRPFNGELFGLGAGNRLYVINPITGVATQRGTDFPVVMLSGTAFGFDFNPAVDRMRVVSDTGQNIRLNPFNGSLAGNDTPLTPGSVVAGAAYTNNYAGASRTTLYDIDTNQNTLVHQGSIFGAPTSPNAGTIFPMGPLGIDPDNATRVQTAFDIFSPVPGVNRAFASLTTTGTFSVLFRVNLISGAVTGVAPIGATFPGLSLVRGLAAAPAGVVQFSAASYLVSESGGTATITINRVGGSEGTVNVLFTTSDQTALSGIDYTDADQVVSFGPGETLKTVQVPITNDGNDELNETVLLRLQDQGGAAVIGSQSAAILTIVDDDVATPTLSGQSSSTAALGEPIFDVATISSNSAAPITGTLTFQLFGPNDSSCGGAPIFTSMVTVNGNGNYASASFTPTTPGTYRWVVSYSGDVDHNTAVNTACSGPNQSFDATATVLGNISTRLRVETGDNALIAGFIITGTQPKKVIVRGIGPSLPFADKLADPTLELRDSMGQLIEANDNWVDSPNKQAIIDSTIPPGSNLESAIVATLPANNSGYTAILRGANNGTGIGVVEAFDLNRLVDSQLANISTRGFVATGDNVLFAGTIVVGKNPRNVIIRAIGPSLNLPNKMADPILELHDQNGDLLQVNDNWVDSPDKQAIINSTVAPTNDLESAIIASLPGNTTNYTAIVRGVNGTTGIAVVEVFALP